MIAFVIGGTGYGGRPLIARLIECGHLRSRAGTRGLLPVRVVEVPEIRRV